MTLRDQLRSKRLIVFLGTGGVGKTTIAAASALEASRTRRTLVLTIDPAKRLADSMGVKLGSEIVNVKPNLDALMLDTKAALDALVRRYANDSHTVQRIFQSRFYEQLSDAFAGSEEFVAMGTLHDLLAYGGYETIIVDTPPSRHAIEFLRVNRKLIRVYESGVVRYLFKPTRFLRLGGGYMAQVLARWTSSEYVNELAEFMTTFDQMFQDMETRVRTMDTVLADPSRTALNIVAAPEEESVPQTTRLYDEVTRTLALPVESCIVNRYYPKLPHGGITERDASALARHVHKPQQDVEQFLREANVATRFYDLIAADHEKHALRLRANLAGVEFLVVPALPGSVHDLAGLENVREALFG
ncbi:MAG: ArsA-related P-loop ATPase [Candidatus Thermoplasmatota archaeon]